MKRGHFVITLGALLILQPAAFSKNKHSHSLNAFRVKTDVNSGIKKSAAHRLQTLPIAEEQMQNDKTPVLEIQVDPVPTVQLQPDGTEDPNAPAGALYTASDETG
jgi:hypothetical protein